MNDVQKGLLFVGILASIGVIGYALIILSPVLVPFLVALALAYLTDPLVEKMTRGKKIKLVRTIAVILVFLLLAIITVLLFVFIIPVIQKQLSEFIKQVPVGVEWVQTIFIPKISAFLGLEDIEIGLSTLKQTAMQHLSSATDFVTWVWQAIFQSGLTLLHWSFNFGLIIVVTFYLLRDWQKCLTGFKNLLPKSMKAQIIYMAKKCDEVLGVFFKGQLIVMVALGAIYSIGLALVGVKFSLLLGTSAGLLSIVPYLGGIVGLLLTLVVAFAQSHELLSLFWVLLVFGIGNIIEGMVLTPLLIGDKLGLHPVAVIFAILAGGQLFGFVGILLALPVAAMMVVLLREPLANWVAVT